MRTLTTTPTRGPRDSCRPRTRALGVKRHRIAVDLTPQAVEQVATRVTQLLRQTNQQQQQPELLSAGELAHYLRVERPWIYKNRHLLGGQRIGHGPKGRWRFDRQTATQALQQHQAQLDDRGGA